MRFNLIFAIFLAMASLVPTLASAQGINPFGRSGFELSDSDVDALKAAGKKIYTNEDVAVGEVEAWNNPETGNYGTVTMTKRHAYKGLPCRRLQHDIFLKKQAREFRYIVDRCRTTDGEWKLL